MIDRSLELLQTGNEEDKEAAATQLIAAGERALSGLEIALTGGDTDTRWWSTRVLAEIPGATAEQLLIATLSDTDEDVRVCAAMGLGERRLVSPAAVNGLLALLARANGYESRHIGDALSKIGELAVPGLIRALESPTAVARSQAARALVRIESTNAIPALIKALDDPEPTVEHYAWEALQRMGVGTTVFFKF